MKTSIPTPQPSQDDAGEPRRDDQRHHGQDETKEHAAIVAGRARTAETSKHFCCMIASATVQSPTPEVRA